MSNHLPPLELPALNLAEALSFDLSTLGADCKWLDAASFSILRFTTTNTTHDDEETEEPSSPLPLAEQLNLGSDVEFIRHYECEECSGFGSDLLWGYVVEGDASSSAKAGASAQQIKDAAAAASAGGNYHQQQRAKQQQQQPKSKQSGNARGELGSNVQGQQIINLTADDYETDWYEILCIEDEGCGDADLKTAFRRRCLETHPDKRQGSDAEFKKVQRAFEILSSPDARRQFDSSRSFDDSIPPSGVDFDDKPKEFIDMYKPVFARNARWSTVQVTVNIGDEKTPIADVRKFYDFWLGFRSWRDFSHVAELEDIHEGMPRYEKRFYQQENERILNGHKKQEAKRIRELVDHAMTADPRLRAEAKRVEAERVAAIEARKEAQRLAFAERARQEQELKEKEQAAVVQAKESVVRSRLSWKEAKTSVLDKYRELGLLVEDTASKGILPDKVHVANIDWVFSKVPQTKDPLEISARILEIDDDATPVAHFNAFITEFEKSLGQTRYGEIIKKEQPKPVVKKAVTAAVATAAVAWSEEDIIGLTKAIAKYPGGSVDRWRKIAVMLREKFTEEQILTKTKQLESTSKSGGASVLTQVTSTQGAAAASATGEIASTAATATSEGDAGGEEDWTAKQQSELEEGLRALADYKEKDKWIKVALHVTGKTAKQCFDRYKHLVSVATKGKK